MGVKPLTYLEPSSRTRAEQWARLDAEYAAAKQAKERKSDDGLDSFVLGVATGIAVGSKSMVGAALHNSSEPASDTSSGASDSSYDSGSSSSDSSGGSFD